MIYSRDTPFWSETLDMEQPVTHRIAWNIQSNLKHTEQCETKNSNIETYRATWNIIQSKLKRIE